MRPGREGLGWAGGAGAGRHHPELLERALFLERNALTGRHSRFNEVEFGATWEELVRNADRFPSSNTTVGLGRNFCLEPLGENEPRYRCRFPCAA